MKMANEWGKRLLSLVLTFALALGTGHFTAQEIKAAQTDKAVITLYTLGGTISSAVQGGEPDNRAWYQTDTGVYQRVLNSYQRLPNAIAPCYSDTVEFDGWYDSMDYTNRIEDVFVESGSMELYAKWIYKDITGQNDNMWYQYNPVTVDVRGLNGEDKIQTTYNNNGYGYYCKIGSPAKPFETISDIMLSLPAEKGKSIFHKPNPKYNIYIASLITIDGTYATMHYIVVNAGNEDVSNFSLGYAADIMIGNDDGALATTGQNEAGTNTYIQMTERNGGKVFRLYVKGASYGITDADHLWIGLYNNNGVSYKQHAFDNDPTPTTGGDSAFACSWVNRTVPANSSAIWSIKLGVGELSEMSDSSNTVKLDANGGVFRDGNEINEHSGNSIPIGSLEIPTRIGYKFDGWYLTRDGGDKQTGNITQSLTLYAHWKEALYNLANDTVVQTNTNQTVPKELADITVSLGETKLGREEIAEEVIRTGEELSLSLDITDGYYLPKSIYVDIRGIEGITHLTEGTGYRYELNESRTKAQIIVPPEYITGDVIITTIGHPVPAERPEYVEAVTENGTHTIEIALGDPAPVLSAAVLPEALPEHIYEFQWYENSEASNQNGGKIPGATGEAYTFPSGRALGDYYFYCNVLSKRNNGQTANRISNYVKVHIKKATRTVTLADKQALATGEPITIGEAAITPDVSAPSSVSYVYYTDEACTKRTTPHGCGAVAEGGAPAAVGNYYVKAYVPEDDNFEAAENTPAAKLSIRPREHQVTIRVCLDGKDWENHGRAFTLINADGTAISDLTKVVSGTYRIYDTTPESQAKSGAAETGTDTGVTVTVEDTDTEAVIHYYTVTFYGENDAYGEDTPQKPQIILAGQNAVQPNDPPNRPGYAFEGWMTQPQGNTRYRFSDAVHATTDLYAKWSTLDLPYRIEHYLSDKNGDYKCEETEELFGIINELKIAAPKSYSGFQENTQNTDRIPFGTITADSPLVLKLYYDPIEYTLSYDTGGGEWPAGAKNPASYTILSDNITLINPVKEGYSFTGWTQPGNDTPQKQITIPAGSIGNRSFTANWEIQDFSYQVEHYLQNTSGGYTKKETEPQKGTFGEEQCAIAKEYAGYEEDLQNPMRIPNGTVKADGSLVLKLYYNLIEYQITYNLNGGALPKGRKNPAAYTVLSDGIALINPQKPGYAFTGWTKEDSDAPQTEVSILAGSTGDKHFTANWETVDLPYRVEHYLQADGGGIYALKETEHLTGIIGEEKNAEPKEYTGYSENEQYPGRIPAGTLDADGPLILRLYYAPIEYAIHYDLDGGQLPKGTANPSRYTIQSDDIVLANPQKAGYIFTGWSVQNQRTLAEHVTIPAGSTGDFSFTANWEADPQTPYWVEHYQENPSGDGYSLIDRELLAGTTGTAAIADAKEYTGFTENTKHISRKDSGQITADNPLVLRLYYDRQTYVITFIVDTKKADVHGKTVQTLRHGQAIAKPFVIPKEGYALNAAYDGWDREVPANAEQEATYTAQINGNGVGAPLKDAEVEITKTDTDRTDPKASRFYPLMLLAYGKEESIQLKWKSIKEADGYILYGSPCGTDMKRIRTIKGGKSKSYTIKKLKKATYYKYLIVAYKNVNGKKRVIHTSKSVHAVTNGGKNGNPFDISCKPASLTLKKGTSKTLKPTYQETKPIKMHIAKFRFHSDNPKTASVSGKGKVTAKRTGTCYIYVYAQNGFYKKVWIKVTR